MLPRKPPPTRRGLDEAAELPVAADFEAAEVAVAPSLAAEPVQEPRAARERGPPARLAPLKPS